MSDPKVEEAQRHYSRAVELEKKGEDPVEAYSAGLALAPEEWAYQNRGWVYFKRDEFAKAADDWSKVGDDYAKPRGRAKLKIGDVDGAIADFQIALAAKAAPDLHGYLAEAYAAKGDDALAAKHRAKANPPPAAPPWTPAKPKKGESHDAYVERLLASGPFAAATKKAIAALRKPAIFVATTKTAPREVGASRIGGEPDLPKGTKWPRHGKQPMSFVAQFRLEDVAALAKTALPKKGLLAFFVAEQDDYLEKGAVLHVDGKKLEKTPLPEDFRRFEDGELVRKAYARRGVQLTLAHKLPSSSHPLAKKVAWKPGEELAYHALYEATVVFDRHQLLGFRDRSYDGEQKATTALLLQCWSERDLTFGDEDHLYFYIPEKALAAGDFAKAFTYSGD